MIRKLRLPVAVAFVLSMLPGFASFARAVDVNGPFRRVASDASGVTIEYTAPDPSLGRTTSEFGAFDVITLADHARLAVPGRPALPVRSVAIAVPEGAEVRLTVEPLKKQ